ncbi:MAG: hypothetical protein ABWZ98_10950 [Nakamurella sp.]
MSKIRVRPQSTRWWLIGGAVLAVLIVAVGWFGVIDPQLTAAAATRDQAESARMENILLESKNDKLEEQNENAAALRTDLAAALAALPSDGGLPEFTRQLSAQATATSVVLNSVVIGSASSVELPVATTGDTADPETTAALEPAAGLVQITVTVTATGLGADNQAFLQAIQLTGPRRAVVTSSELSPASVNEGGISGPSTMTLTLTIFSAPLAPADQVALEKLLSGG